MRAAILTLAVLIYALPAVLVPPAFAFLLPEERAQHLACDPNSFAVSRTIANPRERALRYDYLISGKLETPTPGYTYTLEREVPQSPDYPLTQHLRLKLIAPEGIVIQVIGEIEISETIRLPNINTERVEIAIEKSFNWGPDKVTCVIPYE